MVKKGKVILCSIMALVMGATQIPITNFQVEASEIKTNQISTFYYNGDIITVDKTKGETKSGQPIYAKGVLTKDGKIQAVAYSNDELKKLEKTAEEQNSFRVDLKGDTLVPGFFDSHSHLDMVDKYYDATPASGVTSMDSLISNGKQQLSDWKEKNKSKLETRTQEDQYWFITHGFDNTAFEQDGYRMPTKEDLDKISTEYPIVYIHASDHLAVVNSLALKLFNKKLFQAYGSISTVNQIRKFWDVKDGSKPLEKTDDVSDFAGVLRENGFFAVFYYPSIYNLASDTKYLGTLGENKDIVAQALKTYAKNGITTANGNVSSVMGQLEDSEKIIDVYNDTSYDLVKSADSITPSAKAQYNEDHVKTGPIKIFLDGSPQGKTAWFEEDLTDSLSHGGYYKNANEEILDGTEGKEYWWGGENASKMTDEELTKEFLYAVQHKLQVVAHANGTAAISQFIHCYQKALEEAGIDVTNEGEVRKIGDEIRPVIIHAQTITQNQLKEADKLDINLSFFTDHVYYYGDYHLSSTLGPVRGQLISPMKDALEKNINITMHQDSPIIYPNMLFSIFNASNRITKSGQAIGRGSANGDSDARITKRIEENVKNDVKDERISGYEALKAVTINGAWQNFEEDKKGSISVGKQADFVIINKNPVEQEFLGLNAAEAQKNQFIQETINDDKVIYKAETSNIVHSSPEKPSTSNTSAASNTTANTLPSKSKVKQPTYKKSSVRKIKVTWKKKTGAKGYIIYAKAGKGKYKKIAAAGKGTSKTVTVNSGYSYKFKVKPYKTVKKSGKTVKKYYKAYKAKGKNGKKIVKVTYKNITGYEGYIVYAKVGKGSYKKVKTAVKGGTITYINKNAKIGKAYTFQLKGYKTVKGKKVYTTIKAKK